MEPTARRVVASRAASHPGFPLAALAAELDEATTRLDALDAGEMAANVQAVLSWSYHALEPAATALLGLVALAPGPDISMPAAASLAGLPIARARSVLRDLEAASLIQEHMPGRYQMHDLVCLYAAGEADRDKPEEARTSALRRVTDFYVHTATAGDRLLVPNRQRIDPDPPAPGCLPRQLPDMRAALALTVAQGWPAHTWHLAYGMNSYQIATWQTGVTATGQLGQPYLQAMAYRLLGHACARARRDAEAVSNLTRAISLAEEAGDLAEQAHDHRTPTRALALHEDFQPALEHCYERALARWREFGHAYNEADSLDGLAGAYAAGGQLDQARHAWRQALELHQDQQRAADARRIHEQLDSLDTP